MEEKILFLISNLLNIIVVILKIFLCSYLLCDPRSLYFKQEKHSTRNYDDVFHTKLQWSHPLTINLLVISSWLAWFKVTIISLSKPKKKKKKVTIISPTFHYHCLFFFFYFILFYFILFFYEDKNDAGPHVKILQLVGGIDLLRSLTCIMHTWNMHSVVAHACHMIGSFVNEYAP